MKYMKNTFALILAIAILLLTVIFTLQNAQVIQVHLIFGTAEVSLSLVLFIALSIGLLAAIIVLVPVIISLKSELHSKVVELKELAREQRMEEED